MAVSRIFDRNGNQLTIYDLAEWWIETYPEDIFVTEPEPVVKVREGMKEILAVRGGK